MLCAGIKLFPQLLGKFNSRLRIEQHKLNYIITIIFMLLFHTEEKLFELLRRPSHNHYSN
jgi:hypothetical protein